MLSTIFNLFKVSEEIRLIDNFKSYEREFTAIAEKAKIKNFGSSEYQVLNENLIGLGYDWTFEIAEINFLVSQTEFRAINLDDIEDGEELTVTVKVFKKGKNVHIFDEVKFFEFIQSQNLSDFLDFFKAKQEGVIFHQNGNQFNHSNKFIGFNRDLKNGNRNLTSLSPQCNFNNYSDYKFTPEDFYLALNPSNNSLLELFNKLQFVFLIIHIFDNTEIVNNKLKTQLNGYKTFKHELDFKNLDISSLSTYQRIYDWVHSSRNKIEDKLGITRNILSMYLKQDNLSIDKDVIGSILSANNTYIKENISKYIDVRNKVHHQLEQLSERVNKTLESFYGNFQKTIFVFISFYLSIFIIRTYSRVNIAEIFTKQLTDTAQTLLWLSFIFMLFSVYILHLEKKRIENKYEEVKERAKDILVTQDIEKLLKNDKEKKSEIKFLNRRRNIYIALWIITLTAFYILLAYTSSSI